MIRCVFEDGGQASLRHAVVHAIVERDGALLLARRAAHLSDGGTWGLPGGFLDRDETLAEAVLRELREETGWSGRVVPIDALPPLETLSFDHGDSVRAYLAARTRLPASPMLI